MANEVFDLSFMFLAILLVVGPVLVMHIVQEGDGHELQPEVVFDALGDLRPVPLHAIRQDLCRGRGARGCHG